MQQFLKDKLNDINSLCKKHRVTHLYLFGSASTHEFSTESDIDFLVSFADELPLLDYADNYFELQEALSSLLNRKVDLVVEKSLKNPFLLEEIEKTKTLLYAA